MIDIGYDLFRDKSMLGAHFVIGDILDPQDQNLNQVRNKISIIHARSFFHLFSWNQQLDCGKRLVELMRPDIQNALIYGRQVGSSCSGGCTAGQSNAYLHDEASFQRLWDDIGKFTKTSWIVQFLAKMDRDEDQVGVEKGVNAVDFVVHQVPLR